MSKSLVIFIHGLGGAPEATWGRFLEFSRLDPELSSFDFSHFSYPTFLLRLPFGPKYPGVRTLAESLRTQIELRHSSYENIALICHSLGGLIGKRYLIDQLEDNRPSLVKKILLYAVPNSGSELASVAEQISWRHKQLSQLCKDSDLIRQIAEGWMRYKIADSLTVAYVVGGQDLVVDELSTRDSWGNREKIWVIADRGHRNLVKPESLHDLSYLAFKEFLLRTENRALLPQTLAPSMGELKNAKSIENGYKIVRIAAAALLRIEDKGKYLLIRSWHRKEQFGPIGGVFKFHPKAKSFLDAVEFIQQFAEADMWNDLRGLLPSKFLTQFIEWFSRNIDRETSNECLQRELSEELLEAGCSVSSLHEKATFAFVRAVEQKPFPVLAEGYSQYRHFEVFDLNGIPDERQAFVDFLIDQATRCPDLLWVSAKEIIRGRADGGQLIGNHSAYLLGSELYWSEGPGIGAK